jgi:hypothetical protein
MGEKMTKSEIEKEFNTFFEFDTEDRSTVTSVSAKLFAEHIAKLCEKREAEETSDMLTVAHMDGYARGVDATNAKANSSWTLMCKKMVEAEREECAKVCETEWSYHEEERAGKEFAAAIRARSTK